MAAGDLEVGRTLAAVQCHAVGGTPVLAEEARLAGYLIGDGSVSQKSLGMTMDEREPRQIADVQHCCEAMGMKLTKRGARFAWGICDAEPRTYNSRGLERGRASKWGRENDILGRNAYTKRVPKFVLRGGRG